MYILVSQAFAVTHLDEWVIPNCCEENERRSLTERLSPRSVVPDREGGLEVVLEDHAAEEPDSFLRRGAALGAALGLDVSLALGRAYSRLGRQREAVEHYLTAWVGSPQSEGRFCSGLGLRCLVSSS